MTRCPACGAVAPDETRTCPACGRPVGIPAPPVAPDAALQFTHSGRRYLLGYGVDFFGIWDRQGGSAPVQRFPRTDDGWRRAWLAFAAEEPESVEVGIGGTWSAPAATTAPPATTPTRPVSGAWWLLPIFMGWLGGLIAWLVNRDVDPAKARAMLLTGIAISATLVLLVLTVPRT